LSQTGVSRAAGDLLHNSAGTGSTKWQSQGGWGVQGGKYGQFVCATCHEPDADNVKNIRSVLSTMTSTQKWPNGQRSVNVSFPNVTSMGDDTKARTASNRICEVCHSQNKFHNYSTTSNLSHGGALQHPSPKQRCTTCHLHNTGFKAGCSCHGSPPTSASFGNNSGLIGSPRVSNAMAPGKAGAHYTHVRVRNLSCDDCHHITDGTLKMPTLSNTIQIGFFGFGGKVTSGTYTPYSSTNRGYAFRASAANATIATPVTNYPAANICANIYCHGGGIKAGAIQVRAPLTAQNPALLMQTPKWDGGPYPANYLCGKCHGANTANPPAAGSHIKHAASNGGYSINCDTCHPQNDNASHVRAVPDGNCRQPIIW
jgi:predicted CxxxxCH...CXXCH cytochrome family protein